MLEFVRHSLLAKELNTRQQALLSIQNLSAVPLSIAKLGVPSLAALHAVAGSMGRIGMVTKGSDRSRTGEVYCKMQGNTDI